MSLTPKRQVGNRGEDEACAHLIKLGFKIIDRNYWRKWGEIDVVAQKGTDLRFIEVKTVIRQGFVADDYEPEDNLHLWKRKRLRRIIETYILDKDLADEIDWQIDAMSVYLNPEGELLKIEWLEDIVI
jgi:putative endonuclease